MGDRPTEFEWPTLLVVIYAYGLWAVGTTLWDHSAILSVALIAVALAQFSSLQHEVLHGHPFRNRHLNEALVFPAFMLLMPYERFRDLHLQHHFDPTLTDPYDDPESNFQDPAVWARLSRPVRALLWFNNTLLGRMLVGPAVGLWSLIRGDWALIAKGAPGVLRAWLLNAAGLVPVVWWLASVGTMPLLAYPVAVYLAYSLLKIRTYLEHRAHESSRARTVVIEDRGPLSLLFLNNNFHVVHHMHPTLPWYRLPAAYAARRAHYLRRNDGYVYKSYGQIFRQYLLRAKDPVPHPIYPLDRAARAESARSVQAAKDGLRSGIVEKGNAGLVAAGQ